MTSDSPPVAHEISGSGERQVRLRGVTYLLRRLRPEDDQRLQDFFYSHSKETVQLRYGYRIGTMSHERAFELVSVDQQKDVALGIFESSGGRQLLHAVGRYYSDPGGKAAEIAFVVRESKRRCGMASTLFRQLARIAQEHGVETLEGHVLRDNEEMRSLFARCDPKLTSVTGSEWLVYHMPVKKVLTTRFAP